MSFSSWLKNYMPRSLYGRAAMILLVPVISIQLLVSVVFIQRHFSSITQQMTGAVVDELNYLTGLIEATDNVEQAQAILAQMTPVLAVNGDIPSQLPVMDAKRFDDLTGARVMRVLYEGIEGLMGVDLVSQGRVTLRIETKHGPLVMSFARARLSASNPHQLLVLMVLFSILMTLISYFFLRNQLRPIKRLAVAAEAFGKGRVLPYDLAGATEVRSAGQAFLDMRARIERHIEQRTMILSGVSHDLRTPLTRLKLGLSMLDNRADAAALERDVADMERLVDEFLSFARADALDGDPEQIDPVQLTQNIAQNAVRAGQAVSLGSLPPCSTLSIRPVPITRALENLLANAGRYAEKAQISLDVQGDTVTFIVEDNGPGIAPEDRVQAMKPFVRLDKARNQDLGGGVGLGLAIAADIARAHGGRLELGKSEKLGGLRAALTLPT